MFSPPVQQHNATPPWHGAASRAQKTADCLLPISRHHRHGTALRTLAAILSFKHLKPTAEAAKQPQSPQPDNRSAAGGTTALPNQAAYATD
jgi:hypothetical protein